VVADDRADKHLAAIDEATVDRHLHVAVGVFQIARHGIRTEVNPLADVAMAEKAVVLFVGIAVDDRLFDFAADLRPHDSVSMRGFEWILSDRKVAISLIEVNRVPRLEYQPGPPVA